MNLGALLIQLIGGVAGGNGITQLFKKLSNGPLLDTILGLVGGFAGGQLAGLIPGLDVGSLDLGGILTSLIGGGVGGGAVTAIVGLIRQAIKK